MSAVGVRIAVTAVVAAASVAAFFAWGELGMSLDKVFDALIGASVVGVALYVGWPGNVGAKAALGAGGVVLCMGGLFAGGRSFQSAFNHCIAEAESVRGQLAEFKQMHGSYPLALGELGAKRPCERVVLPSLLQYQRTDAGYELAFSDRLVAHRASQSRPFVASK